MRFCVRVGEQEFDVEVHEESGTAKVVLEGQERLLEMEEAAQGVYTLLIDGKPYDLAVARRSGRLLLSVAGEPFDVEVEDERARRLGSARRARAAAEGRMVLRAPMPGMVVQVEAGEGESVEKGQRLVVLEAMKMENDITAPRPARVSKVEVARGQTVEQGQPLVILE